MTTTTARTKPTLKGKRKCQHCHVLVRWGSCRNCHRRLRRPGGVIPVAEFPRDRRPIDTRPLFAWRLDGAQVATFQAGSPEELAAACPPCAGCCLWLEPPGRISTRSEVPLRLLPRVLADAALVELEGWLLENAARLWALLGKEE